MTRVLMPVEGAATDQPPRPARRGAVAGLLRHRGALLDGHFALSSGFHSAHYVQSARVLMYPPDAAWIGRELASLLLGLAPDVVVGPALGGVVVAHEVARSLGTRALFCERQKGVMQLRRGFDIFPGERVAIVEDVVTTGRSSFEVLAAVEALGGQVIGIGCIVNRSGPSSSHLVWAGSPQDGESPREYGEKRRGPPLLSLLDLDLQVFAPAECPLCDQGVAMDRPGSRLTEATDGSRPAKDGDFIL